MLVLAAQQFIQADGTITDGGELTESYTVENGEVKMSKQELITMIERAGSKRLKGIRCIIA